MKKLKLREFRKLAPGSYNLKGIKLQFKFTVVLFTTLWNEFSFERTEKPMIWWPKEDIFLKVKCLEYIYKTKREDTRKSFQSTDARINSEQEN